MEKVHERGAYMLKELNSSELKIAVTTNRLTPYWSKVVYKQTNGDNVLDNNDVLDDDEVPAIQSSDLIFKKKNNPMNTL